MERLHRFGALVKVRGRTEYCHVTNSGRLRELLVPGAKVALVDHKPRPQFRTPKPPTLRKTRYSIRLAYYRRQWVCIEANIAPKLLKEAWQEGRLKELRSYDQLRAEVPLNVHTRFDFLAENSRTGEKAWIEVKCVTLVDEKGRGFFPDAPSDRASKHLRELIALSRRPQTKCFVFFVLQNPLGRSISPKEGTDPLFGKTLRKAARSKVILRAIRSRGGLSLFRFEKVVPVLLETRRLGGSGV
jgi:sugar fermentation stimulation protein A